jgi:hypothetical protein
MARTPFKLRSGNSPMYKVMGSSPAKYAPVWKDGGGDRSVASKILDPLGLFVKKKKEQEQGEGEEGEDVTQRKPVVDVSAMGVAGGASKPEAPNKPTPNNKTNTP